MKNFLVALTVLFSQVPVFSQQTPLIKYLPAGASMVMSFNPVKLATKIPGETFRQSFIYREMMKNENTDLKAFLADPSVSGIDFTRDLLVVSVNDSSGGRTGTSFNIFGLLKDESLFAGTVRKIAKEDDPVHTYGTNKILFTGKGGSVLAWNEEVFVFNTVNKKNLQLELSELYSDTTGDVDFEKKMEEYNFRLRKTQRDACFELLTPKPGNPFYYNNPFTSLMTTAGDIKLWNNGGPNPALRGINPMEQVFSQLQSLAGKNKTSVINFENGKISGHSQSYMEGPLADIYKKYPTATLNTELMRRLPAGTLLGLVITSVNTGLAKEMIQQTGLNKMLDSIKSKIPFDLSLLTTAFKNNMMLAVIKSDNIQEQPAGKMQGIEFILAIPVADKAKLEELKQAVTKIMDSLKTSGKGEKMMKDFKPVVRYNDSLFVLSLSENTATAFLNNPGTGALPEWLQSYNRYPMLMSLNLKELVSMLFQKKEGGNGGKEQQIKNLTGRFDQLVISGGNYENGSLNSSMEFRFSNQEENALKQLFDMINMAGEESNRAKAESSKEMKKERMMMEEKPELPPPPPPVKPPEKVKMVPVKKVKG